MAHLEQLFKPPAVVENNFHSLDSRRSGNKMSSTQMTGSTSMSFKSESSSSEMKEVRPLQNEFHPITTELHVTELRPIKLDPMPKSQQLQQHSGGNKHQTWERRLLSESAVADMQPKSYSHSEMSQSHNGQSQSRSGQFHQQAQHESHSQSRRSHSASRREMTETIGSGELQGGTIRTVTSRTRSLSGSSPNSSPSATLSPRDQGTAEFRRRDLSPSYKMSEERVMMVDGKCTCCPYGYHVDVDFMSYCDTLSNQSYLKQLKHIQREKRKLRKSMEVYLQDQEQTEGRSTIINPMDHRSHYKETTTNKLLDDIDTSVDQTLNSIETMMNSSKESRTMYSDTGTATVQRREPQKFNTFPKKQGRQAAQDLQNYSETFTATLNVNDRHDSNSSLSSISTVASERVHPHMQHHSTTETVTTRTTNITSQQLAETMATHLPTEDGAASAQSSTTNISKQSLQAIRESMAVSLQRMKELEDQVKAIPVLQVRISVLKEEKRLLGLQMQAQKHVNSVSRGVNTEPEVPKSPATLPKPKVKMAAVGDHSVHEVYLVQPEIESTHVYERETIILDRAQRQQAIYNPDDAKPLTRTVGVGEGNVFDDSMHIHEKELRTVIIGQSEKPGKRNVGIECRVPTRDVGVSYNFDTSVEKPQTRSVGVTTETTALVTNVSFRSEEFTSALRNALAKSVRSVACQANNRLQTFNVGVQHSSSAWNIRTIGVSEDTIDVDIRKPVARRTVSIEAFPDRMNRCTNTDYGWRLDAFTNTVPQYMESETTQTEDVRKYSTMTMTDRNMAFHISCQTDSQVFKNTDQLKNMGTNTEKVLTYNTGMNTTLRPQMERGVNTIHARDTRSYGVNTHGPDVRSMGVGDGVIEEEESEEEYRFEEEGVETKTVYYSQAADQADTKRDKGYEIKREYSSGTKSSQSQQQRSESEMHQSQSRIQSSELQRRESESKSDNETENEEIVEEHVWRTTGDGQFTVTTVTSKKLFGAEGDGNLVTETKTVTGGPEVLGSAASIIQKEVESGRTSSTFTVTSGLSDSMMDSSMSGSRMSGSRMSGSSTSGYSTSGYRGSSGITDSSSSSRYTEQEGSALERVLGADYAEKLQREREEKEAAFSGSSSEFSSGHSGQSAAALSLGAELDGLTSDGGSSSSSSRTVIRQSRTVREGDSSPTRVVTVREERSGDLSPSRREFYDSGIMSSSASSMSGSMSGTTGGSWYSESSSPSGTLKSIMKKSATEVSSQKRGISFADTVVGGETDSEESENSSEEEGEEEGLLESTSRGTTSDSDSSYDEGCYDSREGSIVYKCKDDEAIANGIPGAKMFDQNIRETFELSTSMKESCGTLATYLEDSTQITTKQLNASTERIQEEWFKVSSTKLADAHQTEDYLSCFNEISKRVLEYIVNMQDSNGNTAIHYAVSNCNFDIVTLLLDTGVCDLNKLNKAGYTAVIMATLASVQTHRQEESVQRLFSMGNVNTKATKDGQTALMFAVRQGRTEMVKMLLDTGADTNIQDDEGSTALMCASEHGHTEIVKMLLNTVGCDATISDNDGSTALSIAMDAGHKDAGVLLYAHVNFGPGHSPAPTNKKGRKTSSSSETPSPPPQ